MCTKSPAGAVVGSIAVSWLPMATAAAMAMAMARDTAVNTANLIEHGS
jgi:hypothetical protein